MRTRAERRHNTAKKHNQRKKHKLADLGTMRHRKMKLETPKCFDCWCCKNERRNVYEKRSRLTRQEKRSEEAFRQIQKEDA